MSDWRERARAIRAAEEERGVIEAVAAARDHGSDTLLARQTAFAKQLILEVLVPVLADFAGIVNPSPDTPVLHKYDRQTFGLTCDLDSVRFAVHVFLLTDGLVRIAVFLEPSQVEPHSRDYPLTADSDDIERWFGDCLVKLYEERVPVHGLNSPDAGRPATVAG